MTERFAYPAMKYNRAEGVRAGTLWIVKDGGGDVTLSLKFDDLDFAEKKEVFPPKNLPSLPHAAFAALGHEGHTLASAAQKSS